MKNRGKMIEVNNIIKRYKKGNEIFTALDDVSIKIEKGDFCSVTGPSGAGKSTLLYIIGGLIHPDSGSVLFRNRDIYRLSNKDINLYRKKYLGFMFQQFHLMPYLTVADNIRLACHNRKMAGMIDYFLNKCSIAELRHKYPSELSVGEKQRTAFVRAIISNPEILLADEPTGNLDPANSDILISMVKEYCDNGGTVVLVSHNTGIEKHANRNIALSRGRIC